ncbi:toprim domain-containing protein [Streptomyces anulatus]|uniref:toprim domain-containing protein n=1 Tax=Streptomyces anulatus TaxID=1892 RepID=UPI003645D940
MNDTIAFNRLADLLGSMGEPTRYQGGALRTRGICHDGTSPGTVAIRRGNNGGAVVYCHKCQGNTEFLAAIGWTEKDLFDEPLPEDERRQQRPADDTWIPCGDHGKDKGGPGHKRVAQYVYRDENGRTVHGVTRCDHKCFAQWRPDDATKSGRRWSLNDKEGNRLVRVVPYRLPELLVAKENDRVIWIAEGEKDVHALVDHGLAATCNAAGAGRWTAEHAQFLEGADVTIVADRDEPGQKHAVHVVDTLRGLARSVYVVQARTGKDAFDHFAAGHHDTDFVQVWAPVPYPGDPAVAA